MKRECKPLSCIYFEVCIAKSSSVKVIKGRKKRKKQIASFLSNSSGFVDVNHSVNVFITVHEIILH